MYQVKFVRDDELPAGHDFVLIVAGDDDMLAVFRQSAVSAALIEHAWTAYRAVLCGDPPLVTLRSAS